MTEQVLTDYEKRAIIFQIIKMSDACVETAEGIAGGITQEFEAERQKAFQDTGTLPPLSLAHQEAALTRLIANEVHHARQDGTDVDLEKVAGISAPQAALS